MTFVVEDGTGIKGATSYATLQFFRDYHTDDGNDTSGIADADAREALVAATRYIDHRWRHLFRGFKRWEQLNSRSVLTLTANPTNGETVTVGSITYTFRTAATLETEAEIGATSLISLQNLQGVLGQPANDDFIGSEFADPDVAALTIFTENDGIATTETLANGSFDNTTSSGRSYKIQPLQFPRQHLYDRLGNPILNIPEELKAATAEYAFRAASAALAPDPAVTDEGLRLTAKVEKVGPIEESVEYSADQVIRVTRPYPEADNLVRPFTRSGMVLR